MELLWSRVELTASCYRVCENTGTLAVQVMRSGNSVDPAYVGIQVEDGTAKVGKDFTHSSASLIQFDPGVTLKFWNIYLKDDGLEENHERLEVVLKAQKNVILGARSRASVEIVDPRHGRCDPDDLIVEDDEKKSPVLHPPRFHKPPPPPTAGAAEEDYTPDPNTGIEWEKYPPRGDVPYRTQFSHFNGGETADQSFLSQGRRQLRPLGNNRPRVRQEPSHISWRHRLTPIRPEVEIPMPRVHPELEITPIWNWPGHSADSISAETPQRDTFLNGFTSAVRQHKSAKAISVGCLPGWTHYRRRCYILGPGVASWRNAQYACTVLDSHLTSVRSKTHMKWLWRFAGKQPFWIGLSGSPDWWFWADGTPLKFSRLKTNKASDRHAPSGTSHSCVLAQDQKIWTRENCTSVAEHKYICSASAEVNN